MAVACRNAGAKWQSAYIRSHVLKGRSVDPVDLGLSRHVHDVWRQSTSVFKSGNRAILPSSDGLTDGRLEGVSYRPSICEAEEFRNLLFNEGRFDSDLKDSKKRTYLSSLRIEKRRLPKMNGRFKEILSYDPVITRRETKKRFEGFVVRDGCQPAADRVVVREIEGDIFLDSLLWW